MHHGMVLAAVTMWHGMYTERRTLVGREALQKRVPLLA
jgi:hypothetical protein